MKLLVSKEWLRERIALDPDIETDAGVALAILEGIGVLVPSSNEPVVSSESVEETATRLRVALGTMVRQLRSRDKLSVGDLAQRIEVEPDQIRGIEHDPHFRPRPKTLHQLAKFFALPPRQVLQMAGATRSVDRQFYDEALKFAARSDDLTGLTAGEQEALYAFVQFLNERERV